MIEDITQTAIIKNIDKPEVVDPSHVLEPEEEFLHKSPDFVIDLSGYNYQPSSSWGRRRQRHGSSFRNVKSAVLFGSSHIIAPDGSCSSDVQNFRREALNVLRSDNYQHFFPGVRPKIHFQGEDAIIDISMIAMDDITELKYPVFVATTLEPDNYGRWIIQILPRLAYYGIMSSRYKLLVRARYDWQKALLRFCGLKDEEIINHDPGATYLCREIASISHTAGDFTASRRDLTVFRHMSIECLELVAFERARRVFVSRRTASEKNPHYRVLLNEAELIERLMKLDFYILEPEKLDFQHQVAIFAQADVVVGLGGAAMFNTVFCHSKCKIVDIESSSFYITSHTGIFSSAGLDHGIIYGSPIEQKINSNWMLDVNEAIKAIKSYC